MNTWLLTILLIILVSCLLDLVAATLNIRALSANLPKEFADVCTPSAYQTSQEYTRAHTYVSIVQTIVSTLITVSFILGGGFNLLDLWARSLAQNELFIGLLFIGFFLLLSFLVGLPFSIYSTFFIEERFGFNRTTVQTFIIDMLKGTLLILLLGGPLLASILWFFTNAGPHGWLFCWLGVILFSLGLQFLAPVFIMPMFNKFSPLEDGALRTEIMNYTQQQQFTMQGIFTMDGSKRSSKVNAFFTGFGKFKKIVFFDTLVEKLLPHEILAVLAHEMGHFKLQHIPKNLLASIFQIGVMFYLLSYFLDNQELSQAFGVATLSVHTSLVFFGFLYSPINLVVSILFHFISRRHEFAADTYAAKTTGSVHPLISGLKKLSEANLTNLTPHPFMVFLHYSHPPVLQRIEQLKLSLGKNA
jgi:STE24 endopeptidase